MINKAADKRLLMNFELENMFQYPNDYLKISCLACRRIAIGQHFGISIRLTSGGSTRKEYLIFRKQLLIRPFLALAALVTLFCPGTCAAESEPTYVVIGIMGPSAITTEAEAVIPRETMLESDVVAIERNSLAEIKDNFGEQHPHQLRYVGFAINLIPTLNLTPAQLKSQVILALDMAERNKIPVFFHLDDEHFWWRSEELSHDPAMQEWSDFPKSGSTIGPVVPKYWLNWGDPVAVFPVPPPCFACLEFKAAMGKRLRECVAEPIVQRLKQWRRTGKEYLFAGIASGNETKVPDFRKGYEGYTGTPKVPEGIDRTHVPPTKVRMSQEDMVPVGYHSIFAMGYDQQSLARLAQSRGESVSKTVQQLLYKVAHDYAEFQAKTLNEAGVPKDRIYTHFTSTSRTFWQGGEDRPSPDGKPGSDNLPPPFEAAVNPYSRPGFTVVRSGVDLNVLRAELSKAHAPSGGNAWGAVESYVCTAQPGVPQTQAQYEEYLGGLISHGAKVVNVYGWNLPPGAVSPYAIKTSGAIPAIKRWIAGAQLSPSWYHSAENASQATLLRAKLKRIQETAYEQVKRGADPRAVQSKIESFQKELDPLLKAGRLNDTSALMDRTIMQLQSLTH
jgi:hypothetical protein